MIEEGFFRQIYDNHVDLVYNLCLQYLQNKEEAEEATQDVFVKVHRQMDKFRQESSVRTWIYRITINQCLDIIKYKKRKRRFSFLMSLSQDNATIKKVSANSFDHPGVKLESKEEMQRIFSCIHSLPDKQKTVVLLKYTEHLSQKEISEVLNASEKSVESLLSRARNKLKILLANAKD